MIHSLSSIFRHQAFSLKTMLTLVITSFCITSTASYANNNAEYAGKTLLAKGTVSANNSLNQNTRKLKRRSKIFSVDSITTGENSKAQFSMADGGLITLKENTEILVDNYVFDKTTQQGSATLEVISGGLRSISGLIKKTGGDFKVKTPVGSIGIRGTHFAVEVVNDKVFFGVFSGNIDILLNNNQTLSLGVNEGFSFASINETGDITPLTQAPEVLSQGYGSRSTTSESTTSPSAGTSVASTVINQQELAQVSSGLVSATEESISPEVYNESEWQAVPSTPIAELIASRTGTFNYQQVTESDITSSVGNTSNFTMNMAINFDNGTVPGGSLSLTDSQGEWFAAYSGLINIDQLELGVNFASHGNQRADGDISAAFSNGLDELTGRFNLHETENPTVKASGSFKIK